MLRPRIIVSFLLKNNGFYKTTNFKNPVYIGDPINAIRIFTEKKVDEIIIYDIDATKNNTYPNYNLLKILASESRMPICYGGAVKSIEIAKKLFELGIEKISLNNAIFDNFGLLKLLIKNFGSQSIVATLDISKINNEGKYGIYSKYEKDFKNVELLDFIKNLEKIGVGEIIINNIDLDGTMKGYDKNLINRIYNSINIPVSFVGGAKSFEELNEIKQKYKIIGLAAGSIFFYKGVHKAVLFSYPN